MAELNLLDQYPSSDRPVEERARKITDEHREVAREFGEKFFDGDRLYGYGGYTYHPKYWEDTVERFRDHYDLADDARILDVGCAKGFMLYDFKRLMPEAEVRGIDISEYAIENCKEEMEPYLDVGNAKDLPYDDDSFDLVISINTVHNLPEKDCRTAIAEMERVSRSDSFLTVDAWRNEHQRKALEKWNLTAKTKMHVDDWEQLFDEVGYKGDYWWFIVE